MTDEAKALAFVLRRGEWDRELCKYIPTDERNQAADLIQTQAREIERLQGAVAGLMEIAEMAMPDTYFATDSRVNAARAALAGDSHDQ